MTEDRVTETPHTTIIERRGGGGILIAVILLIAVAIGAFYLFNQSKNDGIKTEAIQSAAKDVGDGAQKVGDAAQKAVDKPAE
ncbi:hypothetical protein [Sphingomonas alpina]|uniref:Uncharacterized protein n=1 Tax=Sphingomonas alpina TaxID=653931 RepID=A0A7H0LMS6_9SPHN|nr:hypothetical protein [Sphingomonas alpina]QNQ10979.1 hypothetical protein H3Z74_07375 [Sphingomonas alpina]